MYYGQQAEDKYIIENFFLNKKNGVFLELGAMDGIKFSNTYYLEKYMGWAGVLIEPTQSLFEKLKINRPNSKCYNYIISETRNNIEFSVYNDALSMNRIKRYNYHNDANHIISYPTKYLSEILEDAKIKYIDFFSLDVEGAELEVLKTMNWDIPVHIILAEIKGINIYSREKNNECKKLLKSKGFTYHSSTRTDEVWINPHYESSKK